MRKFMSRQRACG